MDFARKQLKKYGWTEGKGLGKKENGISTALKPKLKFDNAGVGHNVGEQFTNNWWERVFNDAAGNIDVEVDDEDVVKMKLKSEDSVEISTKNFSLSALKKNKHLEYGSFLKTAKLTGSSMEHYSSEKVTEVPNTFKCLTDEELFAACGGRTAHKGARHGLKLSGKLSRIEKQEKMLLKKMKKVSLSDSNLNEKIFAEKQLKKLKKQKDDTIEKYTPITEDSMESICSNSLKKKKKRKSVSFNETVTVTKIYTVDLDTSFESEVGSVRDENSNEPNLEHVASGSDEGIEQDIENNNNVEDNHRSFEVGQFNINDLSKAERKKLRKKRKHEAKKHAATEIFLQKLDEKVEEIEMIGDADEKDINVKKRKYLEDSDFSNDKGCHSKTESPARHKRKKNKEMRSKQKKIEEKQMNSIMRSLDSVCRISESE
ncbi:unnamed protein product [Phaedon cochleariae]|uniref:G patch domain-containing protein 4 n=1 Tax=Phaedon cochleariae TaxID=80249 RepID=A0A9N9SBA4_PHACE|nr:unnamed protein product [Phaedon cochleariae]